jgi:hypothetical protein
MTMAQVSIYLEMLEQEANLKLGDGFPHVP